MALVKDYAYCSITQIMMSSIIDAFIVKEHHKPPMAKTGFDTEIEHHTYDFGFSLVDVKIVELVLAL
mgnify:CR=1 FL=1